MTVRRLLALLAMLSWLAGCAVVPIDYPRLPSWAKDATGESTLQAQIREAAAGRGGESGFRLLENGVDAFAARALTAMRAEHTLDIQTYLVHDGLTTRMLMHLVLSAAERGVRVRILIDDMSSRGDDFAVATLAAHPNIEVRLFNPVRTGRESVLTRSLAMLTNFRRLHRRMHNKLWLVDNAVAISGGRNLGDEYFGAAGEMNFADIDLLSLGPVVDDLSRSFDVYWNSNNAVPVEAFVRRPPGEKHLQRLRESVLAYVNSDAVQRSPYITRLQESQDEGFLSLGGDAVYWGYARAIWDDPAKISSDDKPPEQQTLMAGLGPLFAGAEKDALLVSAYFVPGPAGVEMLGGLVQRGVRVRVLTNSLQSTDVPLVHGAYAGYRAPLLRAGVSLYEMKPLLPGRQAGKRFGILGGSRASLHTKAMVFDERMTFIGSMNLDPRSLFWNTEVGVVVDSPALAKALRDAMQDAFDLANVHELFLDGDTVRFRSRHGEAEVVVRRPRASTWRRFQAWLSDRIGADGMM